MGREAKLRTKNRKSVEEVVIPSKFVIIEEEMDNAGAMKIITPILHPIELWKETSRTDSVGFELMTVKDRSKSEFALGGTAEEMMVDFLPQTNDIERVKHLYI